MHRRLEVWGRPEQAEVELDKEEYLEVSLKELLTLIEFAEVLDNMMKEEFTAHDTQQVHLELGQDLI